MGRHTEDIDILNILHPPNNSSSDSSASLSMKSDMMTDYLWMRSNRSGIILAVAVAYVYLILSIRFISAACLNNEEFDGG